MAVDLVFRRARHLGGPVDIVFGASDAPALPDPVYAHATIVLGGITMAGLALYDNRNPRRATASAATPWNPADRALPDVESEWSLTERYLAGTSAPWQVGRPSRVERDAGWTVSRRLDNIPQTPWKQADTESAEAAFVHQVAAKLRASAIGPWQTGKHRMVQAAFVHQVALSVVAGALMRWQLAKRVQGLIVAPYGVGRAMAVQLRMPWETGRSPPPGRELWPPDPGVTPPRVIRTDLVFACPPWAGGPVHLVFGRVCGVAPPGPGAPLFILPARFFMAVHALTAHRLPDLTEIPIFDVSLAADTGSFAWTFSASGPASLFEALAPSMGLPAQIRITLDGIQWVFVVDSLQSEERFGKRGVRISGRSATALLGRPYARDQAWLSDEVATAQQLSEAALEFTGAGLDWGLMDWLVPAGAWSHMGTPLTAVQAIAAAAGGYVQSHRSLAVLQVRHPYPLLPGGITGGPWNWAGDFDADVELSMDSLITQSIERRDGPDINGVYVSGQSAGVLALVKRTGTAADKLASMVVDPLITANEAAGQRGLAIVGAGGAKHLVRIEIPVLTGPSQPGVLDVGQLVQVNDSPPWRARVRGVNVNATMPKARQAVTLERHLETAP